MMTLAQRRVYDVLSDVPLTPAQVKRHLPGRVPVATVRSLLAQLQALDLAQTAEHRYTPGKPTNQRGTDHDVPRL